MALILVRHTRPLVDHGVCYGRTDLGVAPSFPAEAQKVLERLAVPETLVSSPLRRCRALARHLAAAFGLEPTYDDRLRELDFGRWEGQRWNDIPRTERDAWARDLLHARPHGGETVQELVTRVTEVLSELRARAGNCVAVTHAGVIRVASGPTLMTPIGYGSCWRLPDGRPKRRDAGDQPPSPS